MKTWWCVLYLSYPGRSHCTLMKVMGPFLEGPEKFSHSESRSKISNLTNTDLFYSHILNMNKGSLHTKSFRCSHLSDFRYRLSKNRFRETDPGHSRIILLRSQGDEERTRWGRELQPRYSGKILKFPGVSFTGFVWPPCAASFPRLVHGTKR